MASPVEGIKSVVYRGYLDTDQRAVYICPITKVSEISSIRLINTTSGQHLIRASVRLSRELAPIIPESFVSLPKHTHDLVDENQEIGLQPGDSVEIAADVANTIYCIIVAKEYIR